MAGIIEDGIIEEGIIEEGIIEDGIIEDGIIEDIFKTTGLMVVNAGIIVDVAAPIVVIIIIVILFTMPFFSLVKKVKKF